MASGKQHRRRLTEVDLNITSRCNLGCDFCSVLVEPPAHKGDELSLERLAELFDEFESLGVEEVRLVGGEPFVRRDIGDILKLAGRRSFRTSFSLDGHSAELHDSSRGMKGSFDRVVAMINHCIEAGVRHRMMTAVTADVLPHMKDLVRFADQYKFELLNFIALGLSGLAVNHRQRFPTYKRWSEAIVDLTFFIRDSQPDVWVACLFPHEDDVPIELYDPLKKAGCLSLLRNVWLIDYEAFDPTRRHTSRCEAGHNGVAIMPNGDVFGCDLMQGIPEFKAGNIHHESLTDIFYSSQIFQRFRNAPHLKTCGSFDDSSTDFSCGQCRAGIHNLQKTAGLGAGS
jgi:radical SAM protein with 4Fe4S-binding SPASM domain